MTKKIINTDKAPAAIGAYSQAVKVANTVYISGQIPLDPAKMAMVSNVFIDQAHQVFANLTAVSQAAGGNLNDAVKLTIYVTDLANFPILNEVMAEYLQQPFPARATVQVSALPLGALVEIDAVLCLP
ncbi:MAG: RidA family protein [Arenicella sp.]|nr:RidA family protein [Arenicella sp.]